MRTSFAVLARIAPLALASVALPTSARAEDATSVDARLGADLTLALAEARSWLGRADGGSVEGGFAIAGSIRLVRGPNEWDTRARAAASLGAAAEGADVVKGIDGARLDTQVVHHALAWLGPFARAGVSASLTRGLEIRDESTRFHVRREADRVSTFIGERLVLTDPLLPLTIHQSAGAMVRPVRIEPVEVEVRLGVGARETFAAGQLVADDNPATPSLEIVEARDAAQLGGCFALAIAGALEGDRIRYRLGAEALVPAVHRELPAGDVRGATDLATLSMGTALTLEVAPGLALGYEFEALREPLVVDAFQYRNAVFVSLGASVAGLRPRL